MSSFEQAFIPSKLFWAFRDDFRQARAQIFFFINSKGSNLGFPCT
jgi:hypothetical protein